MNQTPTTIRKIITTGVYGYDANTFFAALQDQQVDTFVDIRKRRGVRGSHYAFANSLRLQSRLSELGIRYCYAQDLAPTAAVRAVQHQVDAAEKTAKRSRDQLSPAFISAYKTEVLSQFSLSDFLAALPGDAAIIALFCVEREAPACHRSLVAQNLHLALGVPVINIVPAATTAA